MKEVTTEQGTGAWYAARIGKVTASRIANVMAVSKRDGKPLQAREDYLAELIAERLTGETYEHYVSAAMQWGTDNEEFAVSAYEAQTGVLTDEVGFVEHPFIDQAGASPDRLVGEDGLLEVKCPNTSTHIKTMLSREIKPEYVAQMQWQMACTGRVWCDFVSYDPRLPKEYALIIKRVFRDAEYIKAAEKAVEAFIAEIEATIKQLREAA